MWSNRELQKFAPMFSGEVVNVSAGEDLDKEGNHYRDYFDGATGYYLTNYAPGAYRGFENRENETLLDLCEPLPDELERRFDVVFNHTTLEHVIDLPLAFENLCKMSRDIVILVVPFMQVQHVIRRSYDDYWRFTPMALRCLFERHGYGVLHEAANSDTNASIYIFAIASRQPEKWSRKILKTRLGDALGHWLGNPVDKK